MTSFDPAWWWYLSRATGIVAAVLTVAALAWGFLFSSRATGKRLKPAWWMSLHRWLGGFALGFIVVHIVAVVADSSSGLSVLDALVPGRVDDPGIATGIVATYLLAIAVLTSITRVRKRLPRKVWHGLHLTTVAAVALALTHSVLSGSDMGARSFVTLLALLIALALAPSTFRALTSRPSRPHALGATR